MTELIQSKQSCVNINESTSKQKRKCIKTLITKKKQKHEKVSIHFHNSSSINI